MSSLSTSTSATVDHTIETGSSVLTYAKIFTLWVPLALTWLMISVEGPFLAAIIARLPEPMYNLAAYGVAFSFAVLIEAPVIMILSASTALVVDDASYRKLRNFTHLLNAVITLVMFAVLFTPFFDWFTRDVMALPAKVVELTWGSLVILLPWPAAIGYRRFYQGIMIRQKRTRRVAYGTVIRLVTMATTAFALYRYFGVAGAYVGAGGLSVGVTVESIVTRFMAVAPVKEVRTSSGAEKYVPLTYPRIVDFYIPLALTSIISLSIYPTLTFFLGQSREALASLAVYPVVSSLAFVFRSISLSYQEVAITLLDGNRERFLKIARFAGALAVSSAAGLVLVAATPLSFIWFRDVSGLSVELSQFSVLPLQILSLMPFFAVLLAFQRALLVFERATRPITVATLIEVTATVGMLFLTIRVFDLVGVVAAVTSLFFGRVLANAFLMWPVCEVLKSGKT